MTSASAAACAGVSTRRPSSAAFGRDWDPSGKRFGDPRKAREEREERERERQRAIRNRGYLPGTTDPKEMARQILKNKYDYSSEQFDCFNYIIMRESRWDVNARNPSSGAYGIPQALPGSKMASAGSDWRTNPATQIIWAIGYMENRYGSPCQAWAFKRSHGWY